MSAPDDPRRAPAGAPVELTAADPPMTVSVGFASRTVDGNALFAPRASAGDLGCVLPKRVVASPGWVIPPRTGFRCSALNYVANAAVHPANLFILVAWLLLLASHPSLGALASVLGVEAAYLVVLPRCAFFRRRIHESLAQEDRQARLRAREVLVLQMGDGHRDELVRLEALLDGALAARQRRHGAATPGACDATGMARLTLGYIRLAVDHRACADGLAMTDAAALEARISSLEIASLTQRAPARPRLRRWLEIARRRAERWREAHATMESLSHQLATIAELTYLLHQDALCPSQSGLPGEVDAMLDDFEHGERAAQEIAGIMGTGHAEG